MIPSTPGNQSQMTFNDYATQKAAGTLSVVKLNGMTYASMKRFDPLTGSPSPQLIQLDAELLKKQRESMQADLDALDAMLADLAGAQEVIK